ncbi:hypothetical protein GCM10010833_33700 [Blastomonas aquatica]|uniref:Sulfotransferase family protein n=2 Tax=Blastomonas aquatica TaxID=1510276 RepID=A0ABQ1JT27_9SPHN|nr:hypothetical protein GCM10010833_33700 [Blastomonas aquatica]
MFGSHRLYAAGPETQFFSKLNPQRLALCIEDPAWPRAAVASLMSLELAGQPVVTLFGSSEQATYDFLKERSPSVAAMLESLTVPFAQKRGKAGWIEKTPNHLLNLYQIRTLWPDAWIIRIMRDPRDAALSACNLPTFSNSFAANIYLWRRWQDAAEAFMKADSKCATVRYENLVVDPSGELGRLCTLTGIPFDPAMIEFGAAAADVSSAAETWKKPVSGGLNKDRLFAWRTSLDPGLRCLADQVTHEYLIEFDYENQPLVETTRKGFWMSERYVERHTPFLLRQLRRGIRWLPVMNPSAADRIIDQPLYRSFRNPVLLARLTAGRLAHWFDNLGFRTVSRKSGRN